MLSLGMFGTRLPPNPMVFGNLLRIKSGISGIPVYQYRKFWIIHSIIHLALVSCNGAEEQIEKCGFRSVTMPTDWDH